MFTAELGQEMDQKKNEDKAMTKYFLFKVRSKDDINAFRALPIRIINIMTVKSKNECLQFFSYQSHEIIHVVVCPSVIANDMIFSWIRWKVQNDTSGVHRSKQNS